MTDDKLKEIITELKTFDWEFVIDVACNIADLNDSQWRFAKGFVIELGTVIASIVDMSIDPRINYVGKPHKDFEWSKYSISMEMKSNASSNMYTKKRDYRKKYNIILTNTQGTNTKEKLTENDLSEIIICLFSDGVLAITRETAIKYCKPKGDGFSLPIPRREIIHLTDPIRVNKNDPMYLKEKITKVIFDELKIRHQKLLAKRENEKHTRL